MSIATVRQLTVLAALLHGAAAAGLELEISGRLHGREGGLAEARVELRPLETVAELAARQLAGEPEPPPSAATRSGRDGELVLRAPAEGFWRVVVRHPDYLPARYDLGPLLRSVELPDLELQRFSELIVRVTDGDGEPVPGVALTARGWSERWRLSSDDGWWPADRHARTRADGLAAIPCSSGERVSVAAVVADRFVHHLADCGLGVIELTLTQARRARVTHADGGVAAGVFGLIRWPLVAFGVGDEQGVLAGPFDWQDPVPMVFMDDGGFYGEPRPAGPGGDGQSAGEGPAEWTLPATLEVAGRVADAYGGQPLLGAWMWIGSGAHHRQTAGRGGTFRARVPIQAGSGGRRAVLLFAAPGYLVTRHTVTAPAAADLDVRLSPALSLAGRVVDAAGFGVAGVEIHRRRPRTLRLGRSMQLQGSGFWELGDASATSSADGSFELAGLPPATPIELRLLKSGYAVKHERVAELDPAVPAGEIVITLEAGRSATGQVITENGLPIVGAEVALFPSLTGAAAEQDFEVKENFGAATDARGIFTLHDLPPGTYYLAARAQTFPELLVPGIEISAGGPPLDLGTLVLVPGVRLAGRVVDGDGEPVAEAQLSLRNADGEQIVVQRAASPWFASALSRQNGSFDFDGLPRDARLTMVVSADGYLPRSLPVTTGQDDRRLRIELDTGGWIAGEVRDGRGGPAAGARVTAESGPGLRRLSKWVSRDAESDPDGRFVVSGLPPGDYEIVAVSGRFKSEPILREVTSRGLAGLDLQLAARTSLEVTVLDPSGVAVPRAWVTATSGSASGGPRRAFAATAPSGLAVLEPLDGGTYRVSAQHSDYDTVERVVEVPARGAEILELAFERRQEDDRYPISGRVVDAAGLPVAGARVGFSLSPGGPAVESGPDGSFELFARVGQHRLSCRREGYAGYVGELLELTEAGLMGILVELQEGVDVVGRVSGVAPEDLVRLVVLARGGEDRMFLGQQYGSINYAGELRIPDLAPGRWQVRAELLNPTRAAEEWVEIVPGDAEVYVELRFEDGYRLTGSVLGRGVPMAGATVSVRCDGDFRGETYSDGEGRFTLDHVPSGRCVVRSVDPGGGLRARHELEVAFDAELVLELTEPGPAASQGL